MCLRRAWLYASQDCAKRDFGSYCYNVVNIRSGKAGDATATGVIPVPLTVCHWTRQCYATTLRDYMACGSWCCRTLPSYMTSVKNAGRMPAGADSHAQKHTTPPPCVTIVKSLELPGVMKTLAPSRPAGDPARRVFCRSYVSRRETDRQVSIFAREFESRSIVVVGWPGDAGDT